MSRFAQFLTRTRRIVVHRRAIRSGVGEKALVRALLIISVIFAVTSLTARAGVTYTITSYPGGLADLPCDAFEKNADGSWTQVAILVGYKYGQFIPNQFGCQPIRLQD